jgi:hypothetical protein
MQGRICGSLLLLALLPAPGARAAAPDVFGQGARSAALAQADLADPEPALAPRINAAAAARPGVRLHLGYRYSGIGLALDGRDAGVEDASGLDLGAQIGGRLGRAAQGGLALAAHLPDRHLARVGFRPATEPQFVRYEAALQRVTADLVGALRIGPFSIGAGVGLGLDVGGEGVDVTLAQDGKGTYADTGADMALPYRVTPLAGLGLDLGRIVLGAGFRGPMAVDLTLESQDTIAIADNPLNGTTAVLVRGVSGYDPAAIGLGARAAIGGGLSALLALEYAVWSAAPPPVADVTIDVRLGTVPSQREARFVAPRFRDTLSPRAGLELLLPAPRRGAEDDAPSYRWAARAGYALSPSPVPPQTGFTSYADADRHTIALGGGHRFGRVAGVDLAADVAFQLHLLAPREEQKPSDSLPFAHYEVGGRIFSGALSLQGAWR